MGLMEPSIVDCFAEIVFQFYGAQVLVGLRKQIIKILFFPLMPVLPVLIIIVVYPGGGGGELRLIYGLLIFL